jgi:hypothetical protein
MHAKYGPVVRINPFELHIQDSEFYDTLYSSGGIARRRDKWYWDTLGAAGVQDSTLSTIEHELHRTRRSGISPFFSSGNVRKLEPVLQAKVGILFNRLLGFRNETGQEVVNLSHAYSAFTNGAYMTSPELGSQTDCGYTDVIMQYSFARCFHRLEAPNFDPSYKDASRRGVRMAQIAKHLRFLTWIVKAFLCLPESITEKMGATLRMFLIERRVRSSIHPFSPRTNNNSLPIRATKSTNQPHSASSPKSKPSNTNPRAPSPTRRT